MEKVFHVHRFRFGGGEPLLHPDILHFIRYVRKSRIATKIEIVSNGVLIHKIDDAIFRDIDGITISGYPDNNFNHSKYVLARKKCKKYNTSIRIHRINRFRISQLDYPNDSNTLINQIFNSCQSVNTFYAQTFYEGRFYACSRPLYLNSYLKHKRKSSQEFKIIDGISLHKDQLLQRLVAYLHRKNHLASCRYCFGTVGKTIAWGQLSKDECISAHPLDRNPSELVNRQRMNCLNTCFKVKKK